LPKADNVQTACWGSLIKDAAAAGSVVAPEPTYVEVAPPSEPKGAQVVPVELEESCTLEALCRKAVEVFGGKIEWDEQPGGKKKEKQSEGKQDSLF
jgi:hypothetical protein